MSRKPKRICQTQKERAIMENKTTNSPEISLHKRLSKDKHFQAQMKRVYKAFEQPKTMLMVSIETNVLRANICRFIAHWQKENRIALIKKDFCKITKHRAGYYCTNKAIVEPSKIDSNE